MANALEFPGVVGDGRNDDTAGLQAALDSGASTLALPVPPGHYLISQPLAMHSGQTLRADPSAVIRLADHAHAHMLTNADHEHGNRRITVTGGIWDGNNAHQTCEYHETRKWRVPYDPARYLGVLLQFNRVTDLRIAHVTLKDPETFGFQAANLRRFTIEDITFDYNLLRANMDGVHLHGNCHEGRIANLKGATNDDLVALNADDGSMYEMERGPITDILVDGIWAENGYTAVRLLSAGSPIRRIKLANIFGTYRYNVVSFTNHKVHPGAPSVFDDISIQGVFCAKAGPKPTTLPVKSHLAPIWIDAPAAVSTLSLRDYHRTEETVPVADLHIAAGATVANLVLSDISLRNRCQSPIDLVHNCGTIENLALQNLYATAEPAGLGGSVVRNEGTVSHFSQSGVGGSGLTLGTGL